MDPSQGILKLCGLCVCVCVMVYIRQLMSFPPRLHFFTSGNLCYPSMNAVLEGVPALKARSARWWQNVHQEVLEQKFSHFLKSPCYKEVIYSVILIRS